MLDDPPNDAVFERYISPEEFGHVMVVCYLEQGFPARHSGDGGVLLGEVPPEQATLQREAAYRCWVRFPTHPMYQEPLTSEQLRILYDYKAGALTDCLRGEGYSVPAAPTVEVFIASYSDPNSPPWDPYPANDPRIRQEAEWIRLNEVCPQNPPLDELYWNR